ncbi:hypothetical protein P171DRAFT_516132 [Karstenula rhodostoma CBS 690.94]|uniref:Uncharacterized protein n=1 Tax=Karstenula rhodostoma CBS 690.94 TaxID=1392251 RepID=A0A9P4PVP8_9PLEO|nr:hypothetical protein P171DRAFT_516132 [Karstenula rhodostoma CBS 690.94]
MEDLSAQEAAWERRRYSLPTDFLSIKDVRVTATESMDFLKRGVVSFVADSTCYSIYCDLITKRSTVIRHFVSKNCETPILVQAEGRHLEMYLYLLLRNTLPVGSLLPNEAFDMLVGVYTVASKLQDRESKRIAMHALVSLAREKRHGQHRALPSAQAISLVYLTTAKEDPMRLFLLDLIVTRDDFGWMQTNSGSLPSDFSAELNVAVFQNRKQYAIPLAATFDRCNIRRYLEEDVEDVSTGGEAKEAEAEQSEV